MLHSWRMHSRWIIAAFAAALFVCCMVCHGELARLKPHPRYLTGFYVTVSLGGALGGLFVGLVAPNLFRAYYEFPIGLGVCALVVAARALARDLWRLPTPRRASPARARWRRRWAATLWCIGIVMRDTVSGYRVVARNFYGLLRVYDDGDPSSTRTPRASSSTASSITASRCCARSTAASRSRTSARIRHRTRHAGAPKARRGGSASSGLGCGTLAAYGRAGDTLRIYEINPLVLDIARPRIHLPARHAGAGRGRAGRWPAGAGIRAAAAVRRAGDGCFLGRFRAGPPDHARGVPDYFRHLKPDGILAVNITNKYLDLEPVMERAADAFGKVALVYRYEPPDDRLALLLLLVDADHGPRDARRASGTARRRRRTAARPAVPHLDGRLLEYVQHPEVATRESLGAPAYCFSATSFSIWLNWLRTVAASDACGAASRYGFELLRRAGIVLLLRQNHAEQSHRRSGTAFACPAAPPRARSSPPRPCSSGSSWRARSGNSACG